MPNIVLPIKDLYDSVERPVLLTVVRQVMEITGISSKTNIRFLGDENKAAQFNSTIDKDSSSENRWDYDERISMEVDEDFDQSKILATAVQTPENLIIFSDTALGVYIKPVYSKTKIAISIKYKARDKNQAMTWRNQIRTKTAQMRDLNLHEVNYSYHLPEEIQTVLQEVHLLRENVAGYGEDYNDYFTKCLTENASIVTNMAGNKGLWAISEKQIRITGYFDWEGVPDKGEKNTEHDTWEIGFTYNFSYDKPLQCNLVYPLMVHNQLMPAMYRPPEPYTLESRMQSRTLSSNAFSRFETSNAYADALSSDGINIPSFDEFFPNSVLPSTIRILTALVAIDSTDRRTLFNLNELGDFALKPEILNYFKSGEYAYLGRDFQSIFCLSIYKDAELLHGNTVMVDADLNVIATHDLDLRSTYRIRLGIVTDTDYLAIPAIQRLKTNPTVGALLVKAINAAIKAYPTHRDIGRNKLSLENEKVFDPTVAATYGRNDNMNLVQILFVQAQRI